MSDAMIIPGNTAWEMASPINDQPFKTKKQDKIAQTVPVTIAVIKAFCINGNAKGSISKSIKSLMGGSLLFTVMQVSDFATGFATRGKQPVFWSKEECQ